MRTRVKTKLKNSVLALNRHWMPVDIITHKDAFRLMCKGHAKALETIHESYVMHSIDSWMDLHMRTNYNKINTVKMEIPIPEVIILTEYDQVPQRCVKFSKMNLLIRDDFKCMYCGCDLTLDSVTIDHVVPSSRGGKTEWENCVSSCKDCNHEKGDKLPDGKFKPKKTPKEPFSASPIYQLKSRTKMKNIPNSWKTFLFH